MRGKILTYQQEAGLTSGSGLISGDDGNRYQFGAADWTVNNRLPKAGMKVDFVIEGEQAKNIFLDVSAGSASDGGVKTRGVLGLVCFFLGFLGIHRFLAGKIGSGIVMLILTFISMIIFVGWFILWVWWLIDLIMILAGSFKDNEGNAIEQWWPS